MQICFIISTSDPYVSWGGKIPIKLSVVGIACRGWELFVACLLSDRVLISSLTTKDTHDGIIHAHQLDRS